MNEREELERLILEVIREHGGVLVEDEVELAEMIANAIIATGWPKA